jgi:alpha-tubulin suppressor-like RCC1 family protein
VFDGSEGTLRSPTLLPWLYGVALRDLALHETHAACVDARGDVYQWGDVNTQGDIPVKLLRTLRGKVSSLVVCRTPEDHSFATLPEH